MVEAMVVLTVLGIVLAAAVPNFTGSNKRRRVETAIEEMASRIHVARQRAVATRIPHRLVLEPGEHRYWTERMAADSSWDRFPDEVHDLPSIVEWTSEAGNDGANTTVEFESRGTVAEIDAPLLVTMMNATGDTFTLSLVRTGRVTVRPGAP
jgi:Tfp pilus assembly protein FimT